MNEIERILDNKPSRPPMISTLALRWQSICPHGSGGGSLEDGGSPKSEGANSQDQEQTKELTGKLPFCEIQWNNVRYIYVYSDVIWSWWMKLNRLKLNSRWQNCAKKGHIKLNEKEKNINY